MGSSSMKKSKGDSSPCSRKCRYSDHNHSSDSDQPDLPPVSTGSQDFSPRSDRRSCRHHRSRDSDDSSGSEDDRSSSSKKKKVSDEEIAEYLAKKAQKKAMKVAKKLENDSNPFGDSNLTEKFVWRKKIERDVTQGVPLDMFSTKADQKKRQKERMAEIEKVKKRREERAMEKAPHEEEMVLLARERARAEFQDCREKKEEDRFHFDQSNARSEIWMREEFNHDDDDEEEPVSPETILVEEPTDEGHDGSYSPELLHGDDQNNDAIDPEEDRAILEKERIAVLEEKQRRIQEAMANSRPAPASKDNLETRVAMKAMGAMEEGDAVFGNSDEVDLDSQVYRWRDKYRPRKPKYSNRVHTGYEWNKYNQTHYDHDNPPPKLVHGYKFNIFYPNLVDKIKAPVYTIDKDGDRAETCLIRFHAGPPYEDTCLIRFHAGPPYEDVAFRIVNEEWEYSRKKGFKCTFERGILHVYFNFKRYRYRR